VNVEAAMVRIGMSLLLLEILSSSGSGSPVVILQLGPIMALSLLGLGGLLSSLEDPCRLAVAYRKMSLNLILVGLNSFAFLWVAKVLLEWILSNLGAGASLALVRSWLQGMQVCAAIHSAMS
jgi:hypothetical protein